MNLTKRIISYIKYNPYNIFKTIYINFHFFKFMTAIKFPIIIRGKCFLDFSGGGKIILTDNIYTGMVKIGISDPVRSYGETSFFRINGILKFHSGVVIRKGCRIHVEKGSVLELKKNVFVSDNTTIISYYNIQVGENTIIGNNSCIIDTDFHFMFDLNDKRIKNNKKKVIIGSDNWIGPYCMVKKGTITPSGTTLVGPFSMISSDYSKIINPNSIIGGCPAKLIKENCIIVSSHQREILLNNYYSTTQTLFKIPQGEDSFNWARK